MTNERITQEAAEFKGDARRLFEEALAALIALAFKYKSMGANFLWDADPVLDAEANKILRGLSDNAVAAAKARVARIIEEADWGDAEYAWDATSEMGGTPVLTRFDMAGSHLKELMEIWIAIAFVQGMTQTYLKISVMRYLTSPYASSLWSRLPKNLLSWGSGYQRNLVNQIALIGQDAIISAVRYAEWAVASGNGATYYIRRRGSSFYCPECDAQCGHPIPISIPFFESHARCMCWPEYHFEPME